MAFSIMSTFLNSPYVHKSFALLIVITVKDFLLQIGLSCFTLFVYM